MKKSLFLILTLFALTSFAQTERLNGTVAERSGNQPTAPVAIADPSFEIGGSWTEFSSNFGSPVCDVPGCGTGSGTGPNSGSFWVWFGGIAAYEEGRMSQSITIPPAATVTLTFYLEQMVCTGTGFMEVLVNGNQEYLTDQTSPSCGVLGYNQVNVDLSAYQGQTVNLEFHSVSQGDDTINFFIDDVSMETTDVAPPSAVAIPVPTLKWFGIGLMLLLLGFIGVRRFNH